ncbi:hypothetical protein [Desulfobacterium sp. N47]|uniref:STAS domain-containing protein n=1 Tax=uncultured Desulfobacterium sp. TaxID=201089 RepID=E1YH21_9BACT|nr:hypothetical protein N47_F15600 [uncultured Desulfobacterium sp.]
MASNFRITAHKSKANLHLDLMGEFDRFSALELVNVLKEYSSKIKNIIINTSGLYLIHPFGLGVLQKECIADDSLNGLRFIGKHGNIMEPQEGAPFWY